LPVCREGGNTPRRQRLKKPHRMKETLSRNLITIPQLELGCRHVDEMLKAGLTENFAIRLLELFTDSYARQHEGGKGVFSPLHVRNICLWSKAARKLKKKSPNLKPKDYLRVEHGTPRRAFARKILALYREKKLNEKSVNNLVRRYWKLAVITLSEDEKLNKAGFRSKIFAAPGKRWAAGKIAF